jgi:hypothetical protein
MYQDRTQGGTKTRARRGYWWQAGGHLHGMGEDCQRCLRSQLDHGILGWERVSVCSCEERRNLSERTNISRPVQMGPK